MGKFIDLTGQRFGSLLVVSRAANYIDGSAQWNCRCDCGAMRVIRGSQLRRGERKSCGCVMKTVGPKNLLGYLQKRKEESGIISQRLYRIWKNMCGRCNDPNKDHYSDYGGRGISVSPEWLDFKCFQSWALGSGYKECLTLDRINVNGNYEPKNCRWQTQKQQCNNKRNNIVIEWSGRQLTLKELAETTGLKYSTLYWRVSHGWSIERAVMEPVEQRKR